MGRFDPGVAPLRAHLHRPVAIVFRGFLERRKRSSRVTLFEVVMVNCDYCGRPAQLVDSRRVYAKSYGNIWICWDCGAWVGVHAVDGLNRPKGRLANAQLRAKKIEAHAAFDPLWKRKRMTRGQAYALASRLTGIDPFHIGEQDVAGCELLISKITEWLQQNPEDACTSKRCC